MPKHFPMNVAVVSAVRTPVGRGVKGSLRHTRPEALAALVMAEAVRRVPGLTAADVEDVILGCAMPEAEQGLNLARNAVFMADFPDSVAAETVNRFCASGLQALAHAAQCIAVGSCEVVIGGGVESMSMIPMAGNKVSLCPELVQRRPEVYIAMGHTAERVAARFGISRAQQDAFALRSQEKATAALAAGRFAEQLVAVPARTFELDAAGLTVLSVDECPRGDTTLAGLAKLRPAFAAKGSVTAGNASPLSDGAAALVLVADAWVAKREMQVLGRMRAFTSVGVAPDVMGIGPVPAIRKLLQQTGLTMADIARVELNEAFAAQALYCQQELGIPDDRLNVNGGAIALGHPLGCTGAKLSAQLLYELKRIGGGFGIVSMCIGGGMGAAGLFEVA